MKKENKTMSNEVGAASTILTKILYLLIPLVIIAVVYVYATKFSGKDTQSPQQNSNNITVTTPVASVAPSTKGLLYDAGAYTFTYPIGWNTLNISQEGTLMVAPQSSIDEVKKIVGSGFGGGTFLVSTINQSTKKFELPISDEYEKSTCESAMIGTISGTICSRTILQDLAGDFEKGSKILSAFFEVKGTYVQFELVNSKYESEFRAMLASVKGK